MNPAESGEKHLQESTMQSVPQNLTSEPNVQPAQNIISSNIHNVPTMIGSSTQIIGKSVSLDLSPKLSIRKPVVPATITTAVEPSKISTTVSHQVSFSWYFFSFKEMVNKRNFYVLDMSSWIYSKNHFSEHVAYC